MAAHPVWSAGKSKVPRGRNERTDGQRSGRRQSNGARKRSGSNVNGDNKETKRERTQESWADFDRPVSVTALFLVWLKW